MEQEMKVALYMRSSLEQDASTRNSQNPDESDTIANQRKLLYNTAEDLGYLREQISEYVDDGHSGVNFDRPAFQQMIEDVDHGIIRAIIVKDFSRLGRDYIGVGELAENYFPVHNVRLISVNDHWDSNEHKGETLELDTSFRTIIYDMYSRDLSIKRISSNKARNKRGIYISSETPFGYKKAPDDIHKLVIDEKTAKTVRRIFDLFVSGEKMQDIARILTADGVPTPARSKADAHDYTKATADMDVWRSGAVGIILKNEMYTGTLVLNKYSIKGYKAEACVLNDKSEWLKFPNDHEAIVPQEEFDQAQKKLAKVRRTSPYSTNRKSFPIFCGHCGGRFQHTTRNAGTFVCRHGNNAPADSCGQIQIRIEEFKKMMVKAINQQASILLDRAEGSGLDRKSVKDLKRQVKQLEEEKESYHSERMKLYRELKEGKLTREQFLKKKQDVLKLEEECLGELDAAEEKLNAQDGALQEIRNSADEFKAYALMKDYDPEAVKKLVEKVLIYNDGHIKIIWKFGDEFSKDTGDGTNNLKQEAAAVLSEQKKCTEIVAYTSDLYMMPQDTDEADSLHGIKEYCERNFAGKEVKLLRDDKSDQNLFYRSGYMEFIDDGRTGRAKVLLINSFHDLYLSHRELSDLLRWIIPELKCRFISIQDHFDSADTSESECKALYEKYAHECKGDQMKYKAALTKAGKRTVVVRYIPKCPQLFGYISTEDGCMADPEILPIVKEMYERGYKTGKLLEVVRWLRYNHVITPKTYYYQHGQSSSEESKPYYWNNEKAWYIIRDKGYVEPCRYCEWCQKLGRHCERKPIVSREVFDQVNTICRYRKNR